MMSESNFFGRLYWALALLVWVVAGCSNGEKRIEHPIPRLYGVADPQFPRVMVELLGPAIRAGNRIEVLLNGDEIFPSMLKAIRGAKTNINLETYIYWSGAIGREFADALAERARAGVKVHVLLDWVGAYKMEASLLEQMQHAGVQVQKYHKPSWYQIHRLNNRTHRKLLVVDGREGFTGGVGIADEWTGHAQDPGHWRDTHYRVQGPVVAQMQSVFMDNWIKVSGDVLHGEDYFPALTPAGTGDAQMFSSSPSGGSESMRLMYLLAITAASHSIYLSTPYFVPDSMTTQGLIDAVHRGVRVQIITVGEHTDATVVRGASRAHWGPLLEAGIEIYEYQPTFYHSKAMIVDDLWITVGSTNFDPRSFSLNDEANLTIFDARFAQQQTEIFQRDLTQSKRMSYRQWQQRPRSERLWDWAASLFSSLL